MRFEYHECANLFPMLTGKEYELLRDDIKRNGQRHPITTYKGRLLDGRSVDRVCDEIGREPITKEYEGDDPLGFVLSVNVRRRQLNESQRAMIAVGLANMRQGERTDLEPSVNIPKVSQKDAAMLMGISEKQLRNAKKVKDEGTHEQIESVQNGSKTVSKVLKAIKLAKKPNEITSPTTKTKQTEEATRETGTSNVPVQETIVDITEIVSDHPPTPITANDFLPRFKEAVQNLQSDDRQRVRYFQPLLLALLNEGFTDRSCREEFARWAIDTFKRYVPTQ